MSTESKTDPRSPAGPFWLSGPFAPVTNEVTAHELPVEGELPHGLAGTYVRNGPNPKDGLSPHWWFGDGMVHGIHLAGGKARWYRNRYVRTAGFTGTVLDREQRLRGAARRTPTSSSTRAASSRWSRRRCPCIWTGSCRPSASSTSAGRWTHR
ncbi:carotenoid oxygenase family protein [Cystobacter fuscus]